jgi:hypothetical protein
MRVIQKTASRASAKRDEESLRTMFGPQAVDQAVRQAISMCWMALPKDRRSVDAVTAEIRRIVERALANLKEDEAAFGISRRACGRQRQTPPGAPWTIGHPHRPAGRLGARAVRSPLAGHRDGRPLARMKSWDLRCVLSRGSRRELDV